jgi:V/A-type H+-transporting ATPase subunit C
MSEEYIYAVARVRSREASLLGRTDLERLMSCPNEKECLRVLRDKGWGRGDSANSPEELLAAEEEKTWDFLWELTKDTAPFAPLLLPIDGNNIKAAIKCAVTETEPRGVFLPGGQWEPEDVLRMARERDFSPLSPVLAQAAEKACQALLQTGDSQLCDVLIDRACLEEILRQGKESGLEVLERFGEWTVATANIQTAARACKAKKNRQFLELALAPCQSLDVTALADAAQRGMEKLLEYLGTTPYAEGAAMLQRSASAFEKWRDDRAIALIQGEKGEYFTAGPLFAYAVARRREIDTVRIILSGKRNGLEDGKLRERLRETYV